MRFVTFVAPGHRTSCPGVLTEDGKHVVDLCRHHPSLSALIQCGEPALAAINAQLHSPSTVWPLEDVQLLSPLPEPRRLRDCWTYEANMLEAGALQKTFAGLSEPAAPISDIWYRQPVYYKGNHLSVIGPDTDIIWPPYAKHLDFELEIAAVIGRHGRDIAAENANDHIFGFTIFNDVSARDIQLNEMKGHLGPAKGKDFDTGNVLGPWLVTTDEVGDVANLKATARINGETVTETSTAGMHHSLGAILAHISASETIYPCEVIGLGTLNRGSLFSHGRQLRPGDLIELEVEKLGILRNRVTVRGR